MIKIYKIVIILSYLFSQYGFSQSNKILIVNSSGAITKYAKNANEFKQSLSKDYQWSELNLAGLENPENELEKLIKTENPSVIYCIGTKAYLLAQQYVEDRKLLFSAAINWKRLNVNEKTYGISNELQPSQEMSFLKMFFPKVKKVGIIYSNKFNQQYVEQAKKEIQPLQIEIISQAIDESSEVASALNELLPKVDILWVISDPVVLDNKDVVVQIFKTAAAQQKQVYAYSDIYIQYGAVLSVSYDAGTTGGQAAGLLKSIPSQKVEVPAGTDITLNMCLIDKLKIDFNKSALSSVTNMFNCTQE